MDQKLNEILKKGPKFVFATNKYNENDDQIEAEYLYNPISEISKNHSCNGNIKRLFEDFEVLCKSYIRNNKKWHHQKNSMGNNQNLCQKRRSCSNKVR